MKRIISILLALLMLVSAAAFAEVGAASQMNNETVFNHAVSLLQFYHQRESVEQAKELLNNVPGSYNQANYYGIYAQVLLDLHDELYTEVLDHLESMKELNGYTAFETALQENWLPSCDSIAVYAQAQQAEAEGLYSDAYELYKKTDFMDAPERAIELREYKPVLVDKTHLKYTINNNKCTITKYTGNDKYIIIPAKLEGCPVISIGDKAFFGCSSLVEIAIPDGVTSIGSSAFEECISLTRVIIPDSVTSIGWSAFWGCKSLSEITIPDSVTSIDAYAFGYCLSLASISIPDNVTSIGTNPFSSSWNLAEIKVSSNHPTLTTIDGVLFHKAEKKLVCYPTTLDAKNYTIPQDTLTIDWGAFSNCDYLSTIYIPDSVVSIKGWAFYACSSLTRINIPDSVTSIGENAFSHCVSLTSVTIPCSVTTIGQDAFSDCDSLTIYCESGSYAEQYAKENGIKYSLI